MSQEDPQILLWTTDTQTVQRLSLTASIGSETKISLCLVSPSPVSFLSVADVCTLLPLMWLLFPCSSLSRFPFSLSGGKWILLLLPVSCMRSWPKWARNKIWDRRRTRASHLTNHYYHRHCVTRQDKCQKCSRTGHVIMSASIPYQLLIIFFFKSKSFPVSITCHLQW